MVSSPGFSSSSALSPTQGSQVFYPAAFAGRGCKPDEECRRLWEATAWTDVGHFITGARPDRKGWRRNRGEVIKVVSRAELERMRLDRATLTRNGGLLPPAASTGKQRDRKGEQ